jgi:hypothetical protein
VWISVRAAYRRHARSGGALGDTEGPAPAAVLVLEDGAPAELFYLRWRTWHLLVQAPGARLVSGKVRRGIVVGGSGPRSLPGGVAYPQPFAGRRLADRVAFIQRSRLHGGRRAEAAAARRGFYGGWIELVGPFKGAAGSRVW